jgi:DNA-binding NarL/FixJ family response regulator
MDASTQTDRKLQVHLLGASALGRQAFALLLEAELGVTPAASSDFAPTSIWDSLRRKPDVCIVDCDHPTSEIIDSVRMIPRLLPKARVLIVSAAITPSIVRVWSSCKIHGYVVKDGGVAELRQALDAIAAGGEFFSAGVQAALTGDAGASGLDRLSRRESELLPLIARGLSLREAAREMSVSYKTAETYRTSLLRKLGLKDRVDLTRFAIREQIVQP